VFLGIISTLNTVNFFTATKSYQLLRSSEVGDETLRSPNIRRSLIPLDDKGEEWSEILELDMWTPSHTSKEVFKYFSPLQVLIVLLIDTDYDHGSGGGWLLSPLLGAIPNFILAGLVAFVLRTVISRFEELLKDKQILFNEVYDENDRFAQKRLSVIKVDKAVQVSTLVGPPQVAGGGGIGSPYFPIDSPSNINHITTRHQMQQTPASPFSPLQENRVKKRATNPFQRNS